MTANLVTSALADALWDSLKLFPFLLVTYLFLEYLEHRGQGRLEKMLQKSGSYGPIVGAVCGIFPQCGFAAAAANLFAARVISGGTLVAVFLATSDEMLPILISSSAPALLLFKTVAIKLVVGAAAGMAFNLLWAKQNRAAIDVESLCKNEDCRCEDGIVVSALRHAVRITLFIAVISAGLNLLVQWLGLAYLAEHIFRRPLWSQMAAATLGLLPNCSASVIVTQLYLEKALSLGALMAGTLSGAGVGMLVLFRVNRNWRQNLQIVLVVYAVSVAAGLLVDWL